MSVKAKLWYVSIGNALFGIYPTERLAMARAAALQDKADLFNERQQWFCVEVGPEGADIEPAIKPK